MTSQGQRILSDPRRRGLTANSIRTYNEPVTIERQGQDALPHVPRCHLMMEETKSKTLDQVTGKEAETSEDQESPEASKWERLIFNGKHQIFSVIRNINSLKIK